MRKAVSWLCCYAAVCFGHRLLAAGYVSIQRQLHCLRVDELGLVGDLLMRRGYRSAVLLLWTPVGFWLMRGVAVSGAHAAARHPSDPSLAQTEVSGSR